MHYLTQGSIFKVINKPNLKPPIPHGSPLSFSFSIKKKIGLPMPTAKTDFRFSIYTQKKSYIKNKKYTFFHAHKLDKYPEVNRNLLIRTKKKYIYIYVASLIIINLYYLVIEF